MKNILIHIGMHKTGTTSLQDSLFGYRDKTTRYASFSERNHSIPIYTIFSRKRHDYRIWSAIGLSPDEIEKKRLRFLSILERDLRDQKFTRLILSGEDIGMLERQEKLEFLALLDKYQVEPKVIMYTRNPLSFAASFAQENVKAGINTITNLDLNFRSRIQAFATQLAPENIRVLDFDHERSQHKSIIRSFAKEVGIDLKKEYVVNQSLSQEGLALIYQLNNIPLQVLGNPLRHSVRKRMVNNIMQIFDVNLGYSKPDPADYINSLAPSAPSDCAYIRDHFGIEYDCPETELIPEDAKLARLEAAFLRTLDSHQDKIIELFDSFSTQYCIQKTIVENLLEAFVTQIEAQIKSYAKFNPDRYLRLNRDVKSANVNPYIHFLLHGIHEGREF